MWLRVLASESGWMEPVLKQNIGEGQRRGWGWGVGSALRLKDKEADVGSVQGALTCMCRFGNYWLTPRRVYTGAYSLSGVRGCIRFSGLP